MDAVRATAHQVVVTPAIRDEWDRHAGSYARRWRVAMFASKRVIAIADDPDAALRSAISTTLLDAKKQSAAIRDCHLVEAAQRMDRALLSRDEVARGLFAEVAGRHRPLQDLVWVNPAQPEEDAVAWVMKGAAAERHRRFRAQ